MSRMKTALAFAAASSMLLLTPVSSAQGAPPDSNPDNHGQCVSSSEKPSGKGGRSEVARNKDACPKPEPATIDCTDAAESGSADVDAAKDEVMVGANPPAGSSVECSPGLAVEEGQVVSFDYVLDGAVCAGGVPRMFLLIDGTYYNTFDDYGSNPLPNACGQGDADGDGIDDGVGSATSGTVTYTITDSGTLQTFGLVYDQDSGSVTYSNVTIDGVAVDF